MDLVEGQGGGGRACVYEQHRGGADPRALAGGGVYLAIQQLRARYMVHSAIVLVG
jgi:hypothetical protein